MTFSDRETLEHLSPTHSHKWNPKECVLRNGTHEMGNGKASKNIGDYGNIFEQILLKTITV